MPTKMFDLADKVAVVTGGNGGIGLGMAQGLADAGAAIVIAARNETKSRSALEDLQRRGVKAAFVSTDVTAKTGVDKLFAAVARDFGRLDILVNDAAYNKSIPFNDLDGLTMEVWDKIIAINLTGPMRLMKAVAPVMKAQGRGRIVNISSVAGGGPTGSSIAYAVSKAGLIHLTRCMAVALAPETLVNCVAPGLLEGTRATANLRPEHIERSVATSLLKNPPTRTTAPIW